MVYAKKDVMISLQYVIPALINPPVQLQIVLKNVLQENGYPLLFIDALLAFVIDALLLTMVFHVTVMKSVDLDIVSMGVVVNL